MAVLARLGESVVDYTCKPHWRYCAENTSVYRPELLRVTWSTLEHIVVEAITVSEEKRVRRRPVRTSMMPNVTHVEMVCTGVDKLWRVEGFNMGSHLVPEVVNK